MIMIQPDYILLLLSVAFLSLSAITIVLWIQDRYNDTALPWRWLFVASALLSAERFCEMLSLSYLATPSNAWLVTLIALSLLGYVALLEFLRNSLRKNLGIYIKPWVYILIISCVGILGRHSLTDFLATLRYCFGVPVVFLIGIFTWSIAKQYSGKKQRALRGASIIICLMPFFPGWFGKRPMCLPTFIPNEKFFTETIGLPPQLLYACALMLVITCIWYTFVKSDVSSTSNTTWKKHLLLAGVLFILTGGIHIAHFTGNQTDEYMRDRLLSVAKVMARTIDPFELKQLSFTIEDATNSYYQKLHDYMSRYAKAAKHQSIYTMAKRGDAIVFGPESFAPNDPLASPPGTVYEKPPDAVKQAFDNPYPFTAGPYEDEYGIFISAIAPVMNTNENKAIMLVGVDVEAHTWQIEIVKARRLVISAIFAIIFILIYGSVLVNYRSNVACQIKNTILNKIEVLIVILCGAIITGAISAQFKQYDKQIERSIISNFADFYVITLSEMLYFQSLRNDDDETAYEGVQSKLLKAMTHVSNNANEIKWNISISRIEQNGITSPITFIDNTDKTQTGEHLTFIYPIFTEYNVYYLSVSPYWSLYKNNNFHLFETIIAGSLITIILAVFMNSHLDRQYYLQKKINESTSEMRQAYAELSEYAESLRQFTLAIEHSPASIVITDKYGIIQFVNEGFCKTTGYTKEEAIGKNPRVLKSGKMQDEIYKDMWQTISSGNQWRGELINATKTGELYWEDVIISPLINQNNEIINYIAIKTNITDKKNNEQAMKQLNDSLLQTTQKAQYLAIKAEEASKAKSAFLANMSHEIRTPLNAVIGMTYLLKQTQLSQIQTEYVEKITISSQILLSLINDILDLSKIEAGKLHIEKTQFNLTSAIDAIQNIITPKIYEKNLEFSIDTHLDCTNELIGDPLRLKQILINLLGNSVKFTEKGKITLSVTQKEHYKADNITLLFAITDTGIGMDQQQIEKLFQPFTQADESTTRRFGGTGLGLSISKRLVELMGGRMWVESKVGEGSTFSFELPFEIAQQKNMPESHNTQAPQSAKRIEPDAHNLKGIKALLVEDVKINQLVAVGILNTAGIEVTVAENGKEAIEKAKTKGFDVILMDIQMPVMDGLTAAKHIREIDGLQDIPIIAMTANAMDKDIKKSRDAGMNDHLSKPVDPKTLFATLQKWIQPHKTTPETPQETNNTTENNNHIISQTITAQKNLLEAVYALINAIKSKKPKACQAAYDEINTLILPEKVRTDILQMKQLLDTYKYNDASKLAKQIYISLENNEDLD